jgi:hypothetical protein
MLQSKNLVDPFADPDDGRLEVPVTSGRVPVPSLAVVNGAWLRCKYADAAATVSLAKLNLEDFVAIDEAMSKGNERPLKRFVKKWGALGLCECGIPWHVDEIYGGDSQRLHLSDDADAWAPTVRQSLALALKEERGDDVSRLQSQCSGWPRDSLHDWVSGVSDGWQATEAIDDWRLYSWMASEILRLALSLEDDSKSAQAGGDADLPRGIRPIGPHWELLAPGQMLTIRVARERLECLLTWWCSAAQLMFQPRFDWPAPPQVEVSANSVFGGIGIQLCLLVGRAKSFAFCSGCGALHVPKRHQSIGGRTFCDTCRLGQRPQQLASRDSWSRHRDDRSLQRRLKRTLLKMMEDQPPLTPEMTVEALYDDGRRFRPAVNQDTVRRYATRLVERYLTPRST